MKNKTQKMYHSKLTTIKCVSMYELCKSILLKYCGDRDESHGLQHAERVLQTSIILANDNGTLTTKEYVLLTVTAMLHDFADHKYSEGTDLKQILTSFLYDNLGKRDGMLVLNMIEKISFSKEVKYGSSTWEELLGKRGLLIRNIVSDADKIDATGKIGLDRCVCYTKHHYFSKNKSEISKTNLIKAVEKHINEKLGILDLFCRTPLGVSIVRRKIIDLDECFNKMKN